MIHSLSLHTYLKILANPNPNKIETIFFPVLVFTNFDKFIVI